jgi:Fe-S-cluster containining protein
MRSTPSLHLQDLQLVDRGILAGKTLFTVRKGEAVWDNVEGRITVADREMIKVKEKEGSRACIFYDDRGRGCMIYRYRPAQCSALRCWDPSDFMELHRTPKLGREHILSPGAALALAAEHEKRCGYKALEDLVARIQEDGEGPVQEILKMLQFDYRLRPLASERLGMEPSEMDFLFGRPLVQTIRRFGLQVVEQSGAFLLTPLKRSGEDCRDGLRNRD